MLCDPDYVIMFVGQNPISCGIRHRIVLKKAVHCGNLYIDPTLLIIGLVFVIVVAGKLGK